MAKGEKTHDYYFYIVNVKIRKTTSKEDVDASEYVQAFRKIYKEKVHAKSWQNKHCIISWAFEEKENNEVKYFSGRFAQFTYINNVRWFSLQKLNLEEGFKLPPDLFPDAVILDYVFIPEKHRFCYRVDSKAKISPYSVKTFLEHAFDKVLPPNRIVHVDVVHSQASLDKILSAKEIRNLTIDINYSNFDIGSDLQDFVENDFKSANLDRVIIEAKQKDNTSIDVQKSKILSGALETALENGEATAKIKDQNNKVQTIKTSQYPKKDFVRGTISRFNQLVYDKIVGKNGNKTNKG